MGTPESDRMCECGHTAKYHRLIPWQGLVVRVGCLTCKCIYFTERTTFSVEPKEDKVVDDG